MTISNLLVGNEAIIFLKKLENKAKVDNLEPPQYILQEHNWISDYCKNLTKATISKIDTVAKAVTITQNNNMMYYVSTLQLDLYSGKAKILNYLTERNYDRAISEFNTKSYLIIRR